MGVIYKITCKDENIKDFYIGSTKNFNARKGIHKYYSKNKLNLKLYNFINNNQGWDNFKMEILMDYPEIENRKELNKIEYKFIFDLNPTLNGTNPAQYEDKNDYYRKYYQKNPDRVKSYSKKYYHANKEKVINRIKKNYNKKKLNKYIDDKIEEKQSTECANMPNEL